MEADDKRPDGRRRPLILLKFFKIRFIALAEQVCKHLTNSLNDLFTSQIDSTR